MPLAVKPGVLAPPPTVMEREYARLIILLLDALVSGTADFEDARGTATITDWYRTPAMNLSVGGRPNSLHLRGLAIDVRKDRTGKLLANNWCFLGLQAIEESDHYHLELQRGPCSGTLPDPRP